MNSSNSPTELRSAIRYYRKEGRRPERRDKPWLLDRERELCDKLFDLTGNRDVKTPEVWR